jgi:hypothetical protein
MILVKRTGTAIGQIPVYSNSDPIDYIYHWLRISWVEVFSGRLIDQTGDTSGRYLCCVRAIGFPVSSSVQEAAGQWRVSVETSVTALAHLANEESSLEPDAVYGLSSVTLTLALAFDLALDAYGFVVRRVELRPHSAEGAAMVQRYGGRKEPYIWIAENQ